MQLTKLCLKKDKENDKLIDKGLKSLVKRQTDDFQATKPSPHILCHNI